MAQITTIDDDDLSTDATARLLLRELSRLEGVVSMRHCPATTPAAHTRGGELIDVAALLAVLSAHHELVTGVLGTVGEWLRRRGRGRVEVRIGEHELVLVSATPDEQREITAAFVDRVLASGP